MPSQGLKGVLMLPAGDGKLTKQIKGLVSRGTAAVRKEVTQKNQVAGIAGAALGTGLVGMLAGWRDSDTVMGLDVRLLGAAAGHGVTMAGKVKGKTAAAAEGAANGMLGSLSYDAVRARAARYYAKAEPSAPAAATPTKDPAMQGDFSGGRQILWTPPADLAANATAGLDFVEAFPI